MAFLFVSLNYTNGVDKKGGLNEYLIVFILKLHM